MRWPEKPTVHGPVGQHSGHPAAWREAAADRGEGFRTCFYCGSIHPEDLLAALAAGAELHGSDWKYGWPHKFYVDVPNPEPERLFEMGGSWKTAPGACPRCCDAHGHLKPEYAAPGADRCGQCQGSMRNWVFTPYVGKREVIHAKWYNEHLRDAGYDDEALARLAAALEDKSGIAFELVPDPTRQGEMKLRYRAPNHGYQR